MGQRQAAAGAGAVSAVGQQFAERYQDSVMERTNVYNQMQQRYNEALRQMEERYEEVIPTTRVGRLGAWVQTQFRHAIGIPSPEALPLKRAIGIEVPSPEFVEIPSRIKRIKVPEVARQFAPTVSILPSEKETALTAIPRKRRTFDDLMEEQRDQFRSAGKDVDMYGRAFQRMRDRFQGDEPPDIQLLPGRDKVVGLSDFRARRIKAAGITPPPPPGIGKGVQLPYYEKTIPFTGITYAAFKGKRPYAGREERKPVSMRYSVLESYTPKVTQLAEGRKPKVYHEMPSIWKSQVISFPSKRTQLLKVVKETPPHREKLPQVAPPDYGPRMVAGRVRKEAYREGRRIAKRIEELEATKLPTGKGFRQAQFERRTELNKLYSNLEKTEAAARKSRGRGRGEVVRLPKPVKIDPRIQARQIQGELFGHTTPLRDRVSEEPKTIRERVSHRQLQLDYGVRGDITKNHLDNVRDEQWSNAQAQSARERGWEQNQRQINERIERDQKRAEEASNKRGELITLTRS